MHIRRRKVSISKLQTVGFIAVRRGDLKICVVLLTKFSFINGPFIFRRPKLVVYLQSSTFSYFRPEFLILFYFCYLVGLLFSQLNRMLVKRIGLSHSDT